MCNTSNNCLKRYIVNKNVILIIFNLGENMFLRFYCRPFFFNYNGRKVYIVTNNYIFSIFLNGKIQLKNGLERSSYRLMVRTLLFHSRNTGSNPVRNKFQFRIAL